MRRDDFLIAPDREEARNERRRSRNGDCFSAARAGTSAVPRWSLRRHPAAAYDDAPAFERQAACPVEPPPSPEPAKLLYLAAMQALERDRLQMNWGRVQQIGEMDYEPLVTAALKQLEARFATAEERTVLEEFLGFVDQIDGDVAYITLTPAKGEKLYGEYPAAELRARGIHEHRRFKCRTIEVGSRVEFELELIPDREVTEQRVRTIEETLRKSLGDDDGPQDDY
jgi:hypothetical protein